VFSQQLFLFGQYPSFMYCFDLLHSISLKISDFQQQGRLFKEYLCFICTFSFFSSSDLKSHVTCELTSGDCLPESGDDVDLLSGDLKRGWIPD
jgi:hypothetical protein